MPHSFGSASFSAAELAEADAGQAFLPSQGNEVGRVNRQQILVFIRPACRFAIQEALGIIGLVSNNLTDANNRSLRDCEAAQ